jgi:hypothetical protein
MNLRTCGFSVLAAAAVILALVARPPGMIRADAGLKRAGAATQGPHADLTPVLVELFTSEGCSSCPRADSVLSRLGRVQRVPGAEIIVLEEHVDYWDRLGWKDPFSSAAMSARQSDYGEALGGREIYTPQMIVDGRTEFVGSDERDALRAVRAASETPKPAVHLSWAEGDALAIQVEPLTNATRGDSPQVFLAVAENMLHSDVKHGENAGRALEHDGVVRQLIAVGKTDTNSPGFSSTVSVRAASEWNRANLRAIVFVQERQSRRVLAAAAIPFPR